jgi:hydroxymethylpyrimidine/phosphomethylpyrimidine kinase
MQEVITFVKQRHPSIKIVWDPVLKASAGYTFHNEITALPLEQILSSIDLVTPNYNEFMQLQLQTDLCAVLLKGGHRPDRPGVDTLYEAGSHKTIEFGVEKVFSKHGSGCVLSAAITAQLAHGHSLQQACRKAKQYIETFLNSNDSLLGYHNL